MSPFRILHFERNQDRRPAQVSSQLFEIGENEARQSRSQRNVRVRSSGKRMRLGQLVGLQADVRLVRGQLQEVVQQSRGSQRRKTGHQVEKDVLITNSKTLFSVPNVISLFNVIMIGLHSIQYLT